MFTVDILPLQAAAHPHQRPPPLSGRLRPPGRPLHDAASDHPPEGLLGSRELDMSNVLLHLLYPHLCLGGKHGAHIHRPARGHLRPPELPHQSHSDEGQTMCVSVLGLLCFLQRRDTH